MHDLYSADSLFIDGIFYMFDPTAPYLDIKIRHKKKKYFLPRSSSAMPWMSPIPEQSSSTDPARINTKHRETGEATLHLLVQRVGFAAKSGMDKHMKYTNNNINMAPASTQQGSNRSIACVWAGSLVLGHEKLARVNFIAVELCMSVVHDKLVSNI